jgi:protein-tyrosine-phosphatase
MAAAFFNHLAEQKKLPVHAGSAGLYPVLDHATEETIIVASEYGVNLSHHRSRQLSQATVQGADIILTMTETHKRQVERFYPIAHGKTFTLREFVGESGDIADPYGQSQAVYRRCAEQIRTAVEKVVEHLEENTCNT